MVPLHYVLILVSNDVKSTVGYGDISPNTTEEKIFTIVVIFTGVSGYGDAHPGDRYGDGRRS